MIDRFANSKPAVAIAPRLAESAGTCHEWLLRFTLMSLKTVQRRQISGATPGETLSTGMRARRLPSELGLDGELTLRGDLTPLSARKGGGNQGRSSGRSLAQVGTSYEYPVTSKRHTRQ